MQYVSGLWIFMLAAVIELGLIVKNRGKANQPAGRALILCLVTMAWWTILYILEMAALSLELKLFFARCQFITIPLLPITLLYLALVLTERRIPRIAWVISFTIYFATEFFVWVVPQPNALWGTASLVVEGQLLPLVDYNYGPWYSYMLMPCIYAMILGSLLILIISLHQSHQVYRRQFLLIIVAILIPAVFSVLYIIDLSPIPHLNLTPATFSLTGILIAWALFRYRFLDLNPIARNTIIETMADAVFVIDSKKRVVDANPAAMRLLGNTESLIGLPIESLRDDEFRSYLQKHLCQSSWNPEKDTIHIRGGIFEVTATPMKGFTALGSHCLVVLHDVTEKTRMHREVEELAIRDALTGVFNRRALFDHLDRFLVEAKKSGTPLSLIMIDIDHFKAINDTYGHEAGDRTLEALAHALFQNVQAEDCIGRLGGDEFVIALYNVSHMQADMVAQKIQESIRNIVLQSENGTFTMSVSIGIVGVDQSRYPEHAKAFLSMADKALYMAKKQGGDRLAFF